MPRGQVLGIGLATLAMVLSAATPAVAQDEVWPTVAFRRGEGFYLNWVKIAAVWLTFMVWVSTVNWANIDAQRHRFHYGRWNAILFFPFLICMVLVWLIPWFFLSYTLLVLAYLIPSLVYVRIRNGQLLPHEHVLTPDHFRFLIVERLNSLGFNIPLERKRSYEEGPALNIAPRGGATPQDDQANLILARQSPGFNLARELLSDAMANRADMLLMDFTASDVSVRYQVDGVWHNGETRDRETGDAMLFVMKKLAALNPEERRARQKGELAIEVNKAKYTGRFESAGTKTGERAIISFDDGKMKFPKLPDLGMREKLQERLRDVLSHPRGLVLISAPPAHGLTSTFNATANSMDRFVRSFIAAEDAQVKERAIENVQVMTYDGAAGQTPESILLAVSRLYPDVILCRNLPDAATIDGLTEQIEANRLIVGSVRAKDSVEAILRVLSLAGNRPRVIDHLLAVVNQRLVRKLCESCKEAYAPPLEILRKLGIPTGKVEAFYRPPEQPEKPCEACGGIGYVGRTGFFELLVVDDALRQALRKDPKPEILRQVARKGGTRPLQEEGLLLVIRGLTSLPELMRILKE